MELHGLADAHLAQVSAPAAPTGGAAIWSEARGDPRARLALAAILFAAIALRCLTFGHPFVHEDEHFYLYVGHAIAGGGWPYADVWDRKPAGLFLIYALPGALPHSLAIIAYQLLALGAAVWTAWLVRTIAVRVGWAEGALPAALLYLAALNLFAGYGGQAAIFFNLPVTGAALAMLGAVRAGGQRDLLKHGRRAMLLVGTALTIKQTALVEGLVMGLILVSLTGSHFGERAARWRAVAGLGACAMVPGAALLAGMAMAGHGGTYLSAVYASYFLRTAAGTDALGNIVDIMLPLTPLAVPAILALIFPSLRAWRGDRYRTRFIALWVAAAMLALVLQSPWYDHYALATLPPLAAATAGLLGHRGRARGWITVILVGALLCLAINVIRIQLPRQGTAAELAAAARLMDGPPGSAYIFSGPVQLYWLSGRCPATRWPFPGHLRRAAESRAIGTDQIAEIRRIMASLPQVVVLDDESGREIAGARAAVTARLAAYGAPQVQRFGSRRLFVYQRRSADPAARLQGAGCW